MRRFWLRALQFILDFVLLEAAFFAVYWWRFRTGQFVNPVIFSPDELIVPSLLVTGFWHLHFSVFGMYRIDPLQSRAIVLARCAQAAAYGCLLIFLFTFDPSNPLSATRVFLLTYGVGVMLLTAVTRLSLLTLLQELRIRGVGRLKTLVVGSGKQLTATLRFLDQRKDIGADIVAVLSDKSDLPSVAPALPISSLRTVLRSGNCELVYVALNDGDERLLRRVVLLLTDFPVRQFVPGHQYPSLLGVVRPLSGRGEPMIEIRAELLTPVERALKRAFDVVVSAVLLLVLAPLWISAAALILLSEGRPVFYSQQRVGQRGRLFWIHKLRTMIRDAERETGPVLASARDTRVTRIGRLLRATRVDELPQLLNVLLGDMSLVGPRPERPEFVSEFERRAPLYVRRLNVKPGLTGWAQVQLRYDATQVAPDLKLQMDLHYIEHMSLLFDLKILFMTLFVVLRGEG